ncbi:MAG: hypothetical protein JSV45_07010 [Chromatiales bacterium]|nr:MAG: hypothetical protein JSV45_07010 [Chromatiales bacterium]
MTTDGLDAAVRREIEALHEFFVGWFSGALAAAEFDAQFTSRFDPEFVLIPPSGELLTLGQLSGVLRVAHGSNPDFRIAIRDVQLRRITATHVLATYEEWQRNALASTPADNGRLATVLFQRNESLRWLHVHETWLPAATMAAGPYDF